MIDKTNQMRLTLKEIKWKYEIKCTKSIKVCRYCTYLMCVMSIAVFTVQHNFTLWDMLEMWIGLKRLFLIMNQNQKELYCIAKYDCAYKEFVLAT